MRSPFQPPVDAGDVIIATWGMTKGRPWLVLWVDDQEGQVCVAACTSQTGYTGAIPTGHKEFSYVGAWAMIQPLHIANRCNRVGYIAQAERAAISAALQRNLALVED